MDTCFWDVQGVNTDENPQANPGTGEDELLPLSILQHL